MSWNKKSAQRQYAHRREGYLETLPSLWNGLDTLHQHYTIAVFIRQCEPCHAPLCPILAHVAKLCGNGILHLGGDLLCFCLCNADVIRYGQNILPGRVPSVAVYAGGVLAPKRIAIGEIVRRG